MRAHAGLEGKELVCPEPILVDKAKANAVIKTPWRGLR